MEIRPKAEWLGEGVGRWPRRPGREREARDGQRPKATPHGVTWAPLPAVACAVGPAITSLFRPAQPDRPWCAPDQLPPDARRAADGKPAPSCLCLRGVFGGCLLSMHSFVLRHDLPESCVAYTTLICRTWGYAALLREITFRRQKCTSRSLAPVPTPVSVGTPSGLEVRTLSGAVSSHQPRGSAVLQRPRAHPLLQAEFATQMF